MPMIEPEQKTHALITHLRGQGAHEPADHLASQLATKTGHGLMAALREACETVLTAIEAVDPKTQMMVEELRLSVEKKLLPKG